jgi:hypothetical protein
MSKKGMFKSHSLLTLSLIMLCMMSELSCFRWEISCCFLLDNNIMFRYYKLLRTAWLLQVI